MYYTILFKRLSSFLLKTLPHIFQKLSLFTCITQRNNNRLLLKNITLLNPFRLGAVTVSFTSNVEITRVSRKSYRNYPKYKVPETQNWNYEVPKELKEDKSQNTRKKIEIIPF